MSQQMDLNGAYLMRVGESLVPMTPDRLRRICAEGQQHWVARPGKENASADEVVTLLDTQTYFYLSGLPYPAARDGVLARLSGEGLIVQAVDGWTITNVATILLAKWLDRLGRHGAEHIQDLLDLLLGALPRCLRFAGESLQLVAHPQAPDVALLSLIADQLSTFADGCNFVASEV